VERPNRTDLDADDAQSLIRRGFAVGDVPRSMFSESLASSERILGATNTQRSSSPLRAGQDVPSAHIEASQGHGALTRFEKSHINTDLNKFLRVRNPYRRRMISFAYINEFRLLEFI